MRPATVPVTAINVSRPPRVVSAGIGIHGVNRLVDTYLLPELWQLHLYSYAATLTIAGAPFPLRPGTVSLVPPGTPVVFRYPGRSQHLYIHFTADPVEPGTPVQIPMVQSAGTEAPALTELLSRAVTADPTIPGSADAEVWCALHRIHGLGRDRAGAHPAVDLAVAWIEGNLARPITVPEIARASGVSHNHLTRLFRADLDDTVVGYVRGRRLRRARHLLLESTMPISTVARTTGFTDVQAFNKACHRAWGHAPSTLR